MNSKKFLRKIVGISTIFYLIIVVLIIYNIYGFKKEYQKVEIGYTEEVKEQIELAVKEEDIASALAEVTEEYAVEIVLHDAEDQLVYGSVELAEDQQLVDVLNENSKLIEAAGTIEVDGESYHLWYNIYRIPFMNQLEGFLLKYDILILVIFLVLLVMILTFQTHLLRPLYNIKDALDKWRQYRFDEVREGEDAINQELQSYFGKQRKVIKAVSSKNTELELKLGLERERLNNTINLSRALVHDFKAPLHQIMVENELELDEHSLSEAEKRILKWNIEKIDKVMKNINNVLKILREKGTLIDIAEKESVDIAAIIMDSFKHFKPEMKKKELYFDYDGEETELMMQNAVGVQILLHNIFSNMVHYSRTDSDIVISVKRDGENVWITGRNESSKINIERMKKSEHLDNLVNEVQDNISEEHEYSSGNGMYLIKDISGLLGGKYTYTVKGNTIFSELVLPDKKEGN